jgi:hypothetical protein
VTIHSSGQTIPSFHHIESIALSAGEVINKAAGWTSSWHEIDWDMKG